MIDNRAIAKIAAINRFHELEASGSSYPDALSGALALAQVIVQGIDHFVGTAWNRDDQAEIQALAAKQPLALRDHDRKGENAAYRGESLSVSQYDLIFWTNFRSNFSSNLRSNFRYLGGAMAGEGHAQAQRDGAGKEPIHLPFIACSRQSTSSATRGFLLGGVRVSTRDCL